MPHHISYQLAIVGLLWLCVMLHDVWPSRGAVSPPPPVPPQVKRQRSNEPPLGVGLIQRPHGALCDHDTNHPEPPPPRRPDRLAPTKRRPWALDTSRPCCPHAGCDYRGWLGLGHLRAHGHPSGGPWRQWSWRSCQGDFLETHGTLWPPAQRVSNRAPVEEQDCAAAGGAEAGQTRDVRGGKPMVGAVAWLLNTSQTAWEKSRHIIRSPEVRDQNLGHLYIIEVSQVGCILH
jgi:hypothetical protein